MQTWAIFLNTYRYLHSKRLFWFTLALSGLVVLLFALIGNDPRGLTICGSHLYLLWFEPMHEYLNSDAMPLAKLYKGLFVNLGIDLWLAWCATVLGLISTAGIFSDLVADGSIDLALAKPISRLRWFITQYIAGLLFVTLQVTVFTVCCMLLIGIRAGVWEPGLLIAIPIVILFFSYLYCVCVLAGVWTRSTVMAILITILFWGGARLITGFEEGFIGAEVATENDISAVTLIDATEQPVEGSGEVTNGEPIVEQEPEPTIADWQRLIHRGLYWVSSCLPKTSHTIQLLDRWLFDLAHLEPRPADADTDSRSTPPSFASHQQILGEVNRSKSTGWILGTSLGFELVVLSIAAWIFCRRDY